MARGPFKELPSGGVAKSRQSRSPSYLAGRRRR